MPTVIKELLLDASINARYISLELHSDLIRTVQQVLTSDPFRDPLYREYLDLYLSGYSSKEIAVIHNTTTQTVEDMLLRLFIALETVSGYTDEQFIQHTERNVILRRSKLALFKEYIANKGKDFNHEEN